MADKLVARYSEDIYDDFNGVTYHHFEIKKPWMLTSSSLLRIPKGGLDLKLQAGKLYTISIYECKT